MLSLCHWRRQGRQIAMNSLLPTQETTLVLRFWWCRSIKYHQHLVLKEKYNANRCCFNVCATKRTYCRAETRSLNIWTKFSKLNLVCWTQICCLSLKRRTFTAWWGDSSTREQLSEGTLIVKIEFDVFAIDQPSMVHEVKKLDEVEKFDNNGIF